MGVSTTLFYVHGMINTWSKGKTRGKMTSLFFSWSDAASNSLTSLGSKRPISWGRLGFDLTGGPSMEKANCPFRTGCCLTLPAATRLTLGAGCNPSFFTNSSSNLIGDSEFFNLSLYFVSSSSNQPTLLRAPV